jgi:phosphomannomutase
MKSLDLKIGVSGVRGTIGESLTPRTVIQFTRAFATLTGSGPIAVASDTRPSSPALTQAVCAGLIYSGSQPRMLGILPTPSAAVYVREKGLAGGIVITASHNEDPWNGLKFIDRQGLFLTTFRAQNLLDIYHQQSFLAPGRNLFPEPVFDDDAFELHRRAILKALEPGLIRNAAFSVLCDPGGGVGGLYSRRFLEQLGCRVDMLHEKAGRFFPRPPEPVAENLVQAGQAMKSGKYQLGFAQDPDGDRLMVLDENGRAIGGEKTLALALDGFLSGREKGPVVINSATSRLAEWVCRKHGCEILRAPVGEINVVETMLRSQAIAGGEGNGGIIIPAVHPCRDSFTGMALILETLARRSEPISSLLSRFPDYLRRESRVRISGSGAYRILNELKNRYPDGDTRDGLRVEREKYWFLIRISNTEPLIRVTAEGEDEGFSEVFNSLLAEIEELRR